MIRAPIVIAAIAAAALLAACGQKGPLKLPEPSKGAEAPADPRR